MELASLVMGIAIVLALWVAMWRLGATAPRSRRRRARPIDPLFVVDTTDGGADLHHHGHHHHGHHDAGYTHVDVGHHGHH